MKLIPSLFRHGIQGKQNLFPGSGHIHLAPELPNFKKKENERKEERRKEEKGRREGRKSKRCCRLDLSNLIDLHLHLNFTK